MSGVTHFGLHGFNVTPMRSNDNSAAVNAAEAMSDFAEAVKESREVRLTTFHDDTQDDEAVPVGSIMGAQ